MNVRPLRDHIVVESSLKFVLQHDSRGRSLESGNGPRMPLTLLGFTEDTGFRVFSFEFVANDKTKTVHTIRVDLALSLKHGIRIQELPLLCRAALEQDLKGERSDALTFTESEMLLHASTCAEAQALARHKKKAPRRSALPTVETSSGWRGSITKDEAPRQFTPPIAGN